MYSKYQNLIFDIYPYIKIYTTTGINIKIEATTNFSKDNNMEFRLDKCKIVRRRVRPGNYLICQTECIMVMKPCDFRKFLGFVSQLKGLNRTTPEQALINECKQVNVNMQNSAYRKKSYKTNKYICDSNSSIFIQNNKMVNYFFSKNQTSNGLLPNNLVNTYLQNANSYDTYSVKIDN